MMDPPEHDRIRALVSRVFTPRAVSALEPMVREVIQSFLAPFDGADSFDAVADFSGPFPVEIICRMLGVPEGERQQIRHWLDIDAPPRAGPDGPHPRGHPGHAGDRDLLFRAGPRAAATTPATT